MGTKRPIEATGEAECIMISRNRNLRAQHTHRAGLKGLSGTGVGRTRRVGRDSLLWDWLELEGKEAKARLGVWQARAGGLARDDVVPVA